MSCENHQKSVAGESDMNDEDYNDEIEFIPCEKCDGHPACEDFGCAYELGLGKLVKKEPGNDFE